MDVKDIIWNILIIGFGIYSIYLSKKKPEKLGKNVFLIKIFGIILIISGVYRIIFELIKPWLLELITQYLSK